MIRLANDINGFHDANISNMMILSHDKYPVQNQKYIGKWTALRYKSEYSDIPTTVHYTDGVNKIFKRNNEYYYDEEAKEKVPEFDRDGNRIIVTPVVESGYINNRHVIDRRYYPNITINNSGQSTFFQIIRCDGEAPHKVILRSTSNEIIVLSLFDFLNIYDLVDSNMQKRLESIANQKGLEYVSPNITNDLDDFLYHYNEEKVNIYPIQNEEILGIDVYTEYDLDIYDTELTFEDNQMDKYTDKDKNHDRTIPVDPNYPDLNMYQDNLNEEVPSENYPIKREYNNRFDFTPRMREHLIRGDSTLNGYPDETLKSFDILYNVHAKTTIDTPRRTINKGIIIRADINSQEPYIVVAEKTDDGLRIVCSDEARFFFNSVDMHNLHNKREIQELFDTNELVK